MDVTPRLSLPYIASQQAQKQVTYNEAMRLLDILVQPVIRSRALATPPLSPAEGDVYLVAADPTDGWAGKAGSLAAFLDDAWLFRTPRDGFLLFVEDETAFIQRQSGSWIVLGGDPALLGINTSADTTHRLAVSSPASRFSHDGDDHRLIIDKAAAGDTASLLLQSGASGRAEIGLAGDDDLHLKVSPDGATWLEALLVDGATGDIGLPAGRLGFPATANPSADPNTLDDYREGSWTPGLAFGGATTGITYAEETLGRYTRIGRHCMAYFTIKLTSKGSASGTAELTGLPFPAIDDGINGVVTIGWAAAIIAVSGTIEGVTLPGGTSAALYSAGGGNAATIGSGNFGNSSQLQGVVVYDVG